MALWGYSFWEWLVLLQHELILFAGIVFLLGAIDELAVDLAWLWLRLTGKGRTPRLDALQERPAPLSGHAAIFIPAWQEAQVIGATIGHALSVWPQRDFTIYVGCYRNDMPTAEAVIDAAKGDPRVRLVLHDRAGPSTKADCLNRLYRALEVDERRTGVTRRMVVLHDAEDMVDPAALGLLDAALDHAQFVQLPVRPLPQRTGQWIGSHYCEEFAEAHGKGMVVRGAIGAGLPAAGVGCAFSRQMLAQLALQRGGADPFAADCLTEDYELGLGMAGLGARSRFLRVRGADGRLIATQAYFPGELAASVRQKTRWVHGIAFEGWDRLGWGGRPVESWMRLRDRRGPLAALVLAMAYALLLLGSISLMAQALGVGVSMELTPGLKLLLALNFAAFVWRAMWRFAFTAREYGWEQGVRSILRIPVTNIIAIMAGRRALWAYAKNLRGRGVEWDKTVHSLHPAARSLGKSST